jgi:hypothetical protein
MFHVKHLAVSSSVPLVFHVKHQKRGFFLGTPIPRGYVELVGRSFTNTSNPAPYRERPCGLKPSSPSPVGLQRSNVRSLGGSETMSTPPTFRNLTAHSAVVAGGPKDRAVTRSKVSSNSGQRAASSARATLTWPPLGAPGHVNTSARKLLRFAMESRNVACVCQRSRRTSPGSPPPLPRSRNRAGGDGRSASQHCAKPSA